mgnify:FL=1
METPNIQKVLEKYGQMTVKRMAKKLSWTKNLKNNIHSEVEETKNGYELNVKIPSYGIFVDEGRRAGAKFPPSKPIENWIRDKKVQQFRVQKSWKSASQATWGQWISNKSRLFLIRRAIAKRGIKPRPFIYIFYQYMNDLLKEMGPAAAMDVAIGLRTVFEDAGMQVNK